MRWFVLCLCLVACARSDSVNAEDGDVREVRTTQGVVRGHKDPDTGVFVFYSIPYATAPVGRYRFQAPLPGPAWLHPLDAVDKGIVCPQPRHPLVSLDSKLMQEDCLVATVYVPDTEDKNLPVVVYIHGGAFQLGYGDMISPIHFVKGRKLIAVTFNYRLGFNGFLCLGTKETPGNAGLKDQLTLLHWVKKNIASFGGNPNDVTIAGGSAGSVSVDLLMLSKTTKGLFNKIIPESGASVGAIAMQIDPIENAKNYARHFGFTDVDDIYALEKFFQDAPVDMFFENTDDIINSTFGFVPCVERDTGSTVFLDEAPVNILKNGKYKKMPMLFGFDNMEGLFNVPQFGKWKEKMNERFSNFLPGDLKFESEIEKEKVANSVKEFYFDNQLVSEKTILGYVDFFTDILFGYPTLRAVELHVEAGHDRIYLYEYSFVEDDIPVVPFTDVRGAPHCAQTSHVVDGKILRNPAANVSSEYKNMRDVMQEMWYNFITTGKPVPEASSLPEWPAVGADRSPHMSLSNEVKLRGPLMQKRAQFWDEIYSKYYRVPEAPPTPPPRPHSEL